MPDKQFLGTGMKFPPQINQATGRFMTSSAEESVKESIYLILMTQRTERVLRPNFGSNLMQYTFMDVNVTSISMMTRNITNLILTQEPRVGNVDVTVDPDIRDGRMIVNIDYVIRDSNVRDNLVFPFYLNAAVEEEEYEPEEYDAEQVEDAEESED